MSTLKKTMIIDFASMPTVEGLHENHLLLLTAFGLVTGDLILEDETDEKFTFLSQVSHNFTVDYLNDKGTTHDSIKGNDGFISLKNVVIKSGHNIFNIPFMNIFFDQIIGVSIGNI